MNCTVAGSNASWNWYPCSLLWKKVLLHLPRVPNLFVLARLFHDFVHAQNLCALARNHHEIITQKNLSQNSKKYIFNWMTRTFDLRTRLRYYQGQSLYQISWPYTKQFSRESADRQTDTHTDGSVFITSTADAGGNKSWSPMKNYFSHLSNNYFLQWFVRKFLLLFNNILIIHYLYYYMSIQWYHTIHD